MIIIAAIVIVLVLVVFGSIATAGTLYHRVGPNRALIVYGKGNTQVITGGGRVIYPMIQSARELSMELVSLDVAPTKDLYTNQGVAVSVEAVAQIKVKNDPESIKTAAEQLLNKTPDEREGLIRLVMEGHLRGIVGQLTVEQIVKEPEMVSSKMRGLVADDLSRMGLEVVSFTIKEVRDENEYIANMGRPDIVIIRRQADIAAAEAERDTAIKRAEAKREAAIAQAQADQETVIAQTASQAKQAEAKRDLDVKQAAYTAAVQSQQAQTDKAYELQANQMQQQVVAEQVRVEQVKRQEEIKVQELEIQRRERELSATVQKPAEAERQRIEILAGAEQQRLAHEAAGHAEATRVEGMAEAEIIRAKGEAEAEAMHVRANAFQEYNQAAIADKMIAIMPEVVRAMAEAFNKVDRVTIVSTGEGGGGPSALTGELTKMVAQVPAVVETLTGMKMGDLIDRLQGFGDRRTARENSAATRDQIPPKTEAGA
ncbi:MAG TPA: SPFH domain-containing protein [Steroidobacteraceae bacterium]|nr:SPFH domain-containing protein [Steroidobacteraceae bacterium]